MKRFALILTVMVLLFSCTFALAEVPDNVVPLLNAAVTAAKANSLNAFHISMAAEAPTFMADVMSILGTSDPAAVFSPDVQVPQGALSLELRDVFFGAQPMLVTTLDNGNTEIFAELYETRDPAFVLTQTSANDATWLGSAVFELAPSSLSPYGYTLVSLVMDDGSEVAFDSAPAITDEILFYENAAMGFSICYPAFMQKSAESESEVLFVSPEHASQATMRINVNATQTSMPQNATVFTSDVLGYTTYAYDENGLSYFVIQYVIDGTEYLATITYQPSAHDEMKPYLEYIENAFMISSLYIG